jgi:Eco57I restriction-modification methylase
MLIGLSGSLLSQYFAEHLLSAAFSGKLGEASSQQAHKRFALWWRGEAANLGPASSLRAIWDQAVAPLADILGFTPQRASAVGPGDTARCSILTSSEIRVALISGHWDADLGALWRTAVRAAIGFDTQWCLCTNGHELRLVDAKRTYSRAHLQFDLERAMDDPRIFGILWGLLRAEAFGSPLPDAPLILQVLQTSARHGASVSRALRFGVIDAVGHLLSGLLGARLRRNESGPGKEELAAGFDESLTLVYRILFLMFAEARGLVPNWHPIYRNHYTVESLRDEVEQPGKTSGLWETLQAIARLAHQGCHAGTLIVPAFNGRLFSPARAPLAESCAMSDENTRHALVALSTTKGDRHAGLVRIDYRDLGVDELGAVYESVLDYVPAFAPGGPKGPALLLKRGGDQRKATGSFYTPQSITDYLVRRTLHPLVDRAPAEEILRLRIVDPAMGSAAFLVAACRYLARAYERALVRDGGFRAGDIDEADRAGFRRQVAQRCLYGVDLNPTAVQLARLSLWLATLSADKPLTFLDHHLGVGDSLIGASLVDLARQPPPRRGRSSARQVDTPLFIDHDLEPTLARAVIERGWLADTPDDRLDIVREKERRFEHLTVAHRWKKLADLWCACWMWPDRESAPDPAIFASLSDFIAHDRGALPAAIAQRLLAHAQSIAQQRRFFHWTLEFPELYFGNDGQPLSNPGFDAIVGNPPWDMLRADGGEVREEARPHNALVKRFIRDSGIYRFQGHGHVNRYQLFVERAMALVRDGGRIGLVLPSGIATDHTSAPLRRRLIEHYDVDTLAGFDNRRGIFPIHRSVRFVLCTATSGRATRQIKCRFGIEDPEVLDTVPDEGDRQGDPVYPITLTPSLIGSLAGDPMTIPELKTAADLAIVERIVHQFPRLAAPEGWHAKFGRELNATDDRRYFHARGPGLPVLEGKHIEPFLVHVERSKYKIPENTAAEILGPSRSFRRARLAYRDVASATNRLSLIAAVLPPGVVTTHSLFCLKTWLTDVEQAFLCGMLNSYVANYLVRQVMTTHLGSTTVEALRVPKPTRESPLFLEIVDLANDLSQRPSHHHMARLQAAAAKLYRLTPESFRHVLGTFPLVPESERSAALEEFSRTSAR